MTRGENNFPLEIKKRAEQIKVLAFDVDGVLTNGGIILGNGGLEMKRFCVQDGMGITLAREAGIRSAIITGRKSEAVSRRAEELHIDLVYQGSRDKLTALELLLEEANVKEHEIAYMGDDLLDLCLLRRVGLAFAPANARPEVRQAVHLTTQTEGGKGAVREMVEIILRLQNIWDEVLNKY